MSSDIFPEPDGPARIIYVGQDQDGHWLVQDSERLLEGRFVSRGAAMRYAAEEAEIYRASVRVSGIALIPLVPFGPLPIPQAA